MLNTQQCPEKTCISSDINDYKNSIIQSLFEILFKRYSKSPVMCEYKFYPVLLQCPMSIRTLSQYSCIDSIMTWKKFLLISLMVSRWHWCHKEQPMLSWDELLSNLLWMHCYLPSIRKTLLSDLAQLHPFLDAST